MVQVNKSKKGKYILIGLAVTAIGVGGYFTYKTLNKSAQKKRNLEMLDDPSDKIARIQKTLPPAPSMKPRIIYRPAPSNSSFPLKKRSKGPLVKKVQEALVRKYGSQILPKWGVDGDYGSEMESALISKGLPTVISESAFKKITSPKATSKKPYRSTSKPSLTRSQYAVVISKRFKTAMKRNDLNYALKNLGYIKTFSFYTLVDNDFKRKAPEGHWTTKSVYDALTGQFSDSGSIWQMKSHFKRIGLKRPELNGLSEVGGKLLTLTQTKVWNALGSSIVVPAKTILGNFIRGVNGETEFETIDGKRLFTISKAVKLVIV